MEDQITDFDLRAECESIAAEIFGELKDEHGADFNPENYRDEMDERAHQAADGHQWAIYTYRAIQLCSNCDTTHGEDFLDDIGGVEKGDTFGGIASKIAYGEIRHRIMEELDTLTQNYDPDEQDEENAA